MAIAINGTGTVTGISVGGLPDGIVDTEMLAADAVTVAKAADSVKGIQEFDQWYLNTNVTSNSNLTAFTRSSDTWTGAAAKIGTGMSLASEKWTFPSTGKWLVVCCAQFDCNNSDNVIVYTQVSLNDGTSYGNYGCAMDGNNDSGGGSRTGSATAWSFIDVTDTANVKVKFYGDSIGSGSAIRGTATAGDGMQTHINFIRLGGT